MTSTINSTSSLCNSNSARISPDSASRNIGAQTTKRYQQSDAAEQGSRKKAKRGSSGKGNHEDEIAPFVLKTKEMITKCDEDCPHIAAWSVDGGIFFIKNQEVFAKEVIPQFFDHSKFPSFVRQLNFYGFRKVQTTAIYKKDQENDDTTKYVTFKNEFFHRDSPELLPKIKRANKDKGGQNNENMQKQINALEEKVASLEQKIHLMQQGFKDQFEALKKEMLSQCTSTTSSTAGQHAVQSTTYPSGQNAVSNPKTCQNTEQTIHLMQQGFKDHIESLKKDMLSQCTSTTSSTAGQHAVQSTTYPSGQNAVSNPKTCQNKEQIMHSNCNPVPDDFGWSNKDLNNFEDPKFDRVQAPMDQDSKTEALPSNTENDSNSTSFKKLDWDWDLEHLDILEEHDPSLQAALYPKAA